MQIFLWCIVGCFSVLYSAEPLQVAAQVAEKHFRLLNVDMANDVVTIKISKQLHRSGSFLDPVVWQGQVAFGQSVLVGLLENTHPLRVSVYQGQIRQGTAHLNTREISRLDSLEYVFAGRGRAIRLIFDDGSDCEKLLKS